MNLRIGIRKIFGLIVNPVRFSCLGFLVVKEKKSE